MEFTNYCQNTQEIERNNKTISDDKQESATKLIVNFLNLIFRGLIQGLFDIQFSRRINLVKLLLFNVLNGIA